jgi:simple sugar transport system ATP-binding protein
MTKEDLARMMVGRDVVFKLEKGHVAVTEPLLEVKNLSGDEEDDGCLNLREISFTLHRGEILGVAGVAGNGQKQLFDTLVGVEKAASGEILLDGEDITNRNAAFFASRGIASVPEDRIQQGLVMDFAVRENLILGLHRRGDFSRWSFLNRVKIDDFAREMVQEFDIATPSASQVTRVLSGGNLQKVILAREFSQEPKCLIVHQPTRGLDVGATEYVRRRLLEQRNRGAGVLLISEDLDEILNLSSRMAVMFQGRFVGILDAEKATREEIGLMMAGIVQGVP